MKKYKYLLWDIDGTVLDFISAEKAAIKTLFKEFSLGECSDEMIKRYSKINVKYWQALEKGEMTKPEILVGRFKEFFESEGLDKELAGSFNERYQVALGDTIVFCENARDILLKQKEKYVLIAVTNGTKVAQDKKLKESGLDAVFDYVFISEVVGFEKPNRGFFDEVIKTAKIDDIASALVIGDSLTSDIKGGVGYGIDTCWYNPGKKENTMDFKPTYEITSLSELDRVLLQ